MIKCSKCICFVKGECHRHAPIPSNRVKANCAIWPVVFESDGCCDGILKPEILRQMMKDVSKEIDDVIAQKKATIEEIECLKKISEAQKILRDTK